MKLIQKDITSSNVVSYIVYSYINLVPIRQQHSGIKDKAERRIIYRSDFNPSFSNIVPTSENNFGYTGNITDINCELDGLIG